MMEEPLTANKLILDRYQVEVPIAQGGFGVVYRAKDLETDEQVVIKALRKDRSDRDYLERFRLEFFISKFFTSSPNIITVNDMGQDKDNWYLVLEYIEGGSLADFIQMQAPVSVEQACRITLDICQGLQELHNNKLDIVHRDLKPSNILLRSNQQAVIADFGIAQVSNLSQRTNIQNQLPHILTPAYSSPEQRDVNNKAYLTPASDLYSLGLILYELLTGQRFARTRQLPPGKLNAQIPAWLNHIVVKLLKPNPVERYQEAAEVARDIRAGFVTIREGSEYLTTQTIRTRRLPVLSKVGLMPLVIGAVLIVALGLALVYQTFGDTSSARSGPSVASSNVTALPNPTAISASTPTAPSSTTAVLLTAFSPASTTAAISSVAHIATTSVPSNLNTATSGAPTTAIATTTAAPATTVPVTTIAPTSPVSSNTQVIVPTTTNAPLATVNSIDTTLKSEPQIAKPNPTATPTTSSQSKPTYAQLFWNFPGTPTDILTLDQVLKVEQKGDHSFWAVDFSFTGLNAQGFLGLQTDGNHFDGSTGEIGIFSIWNAVGAEGSSCQKFNEGGEGYSCRVALKIQPGVEYRLRLWPLKLENQKQWWGAWIYDSSTKQDLSIGVIILPTPTNQNLFLNQIYSFSLYFGGNTDCTKVPQSVVTFKMPGANSKGDDVGGYAYPAEIRDWSKSECMGGAAKLARTNGTASGVQLTLGGTDNLGRAVSSEKITP